jgi:hypothetical protein
MQLGIIGLPQAGKTTVFELLSDSKNRLAGSGKTNSAMARIPDSRIDYLSDLFKPKKTTYAQLEVLDIPGLTPGAEKASAVFLDSVRRADALLHVVGAFNGEFNIIEDIETVNYELLLADLDLIEKRIARINSNKKKNQMLKELYLLERLQKTIESELPLSSLEMDAEENDILNNYQFLSIKPMLLCINVAEDLLGKSYSQRDETLAYAEAKDIPLLEISASIEHEIAQLEGEDCRIFMEELGIKEAGIVKISRSMYRSLGLISFFTVGEDEVKAWTIEEGTVARKAAGKIHSDIERGFIRAEVVEFKDLQEYGNMNKLKEKGLFRLEGKEYPVKDGDIVHFRFNV